MINDGQVSNLPAVWNLTEFFGCNRQFYPKFFGCNRQFYHKFFGYNR